MRMQYTDGVRDNFPAIHGAKFTIGSCRSALPVSMLGESFQRYHRLGAKLVSSLSTMRHPARDVASLLLYCSLRLSLIHDRYLVSESDA